MALSAYEKETIINFNEADGEANIYTASPVMKRKLDKLGEVRETNGGWELNVPKGWITVKPPRRISDNQRQAARESLARARTKRHLK